MYGTPQINLPMVIYNICNIFDEGLQRSIYSVLPCVAVLIQLYRYSKKIQITVSIKIWDAVINIGGLQGGHMGSQNIIVFLQ